MSHKWDDQRQRQYMTVLDERDQAIERAEVAEAKLNRWRRWLVTPFLILVGMMMLTISAALFLVIVYCVAWIVDV